jgi:Domain of unknown function (DUF4956)
MNTIVLVMLDKLLIAGLEIIDGQGFLEFVMRFALNFAIVMVIVRWLYYPTTLRKDYLFTYIIISTLTFLLSYLLQGVKLQIAFAVGLFAIFRILRFRTEPIPIKEMTYLFLIIGISVINALPSIKINLAELLFANLAVILIILGIEKLWFKHEFSKLIRYEKIDLIKSGKQDELIKDLQERTGISKINRVEILKINFLRDTCDLMIYYYDSPGIQINKVYESKIENNKNNDNV